MTLPKLCNARGLILLLYLGVLAFRCYPLMPPHISKKYHGTGINTKDLQRAAMSTMKVCFSPKPLLWFTPF
jgi:hypothetical protein